MEKNIPEFDKYLSTLTTNLKVEDGLKQDIVNELKQNMCDKYNEFLIRGYGLENSINLTIIEYEDPLRLAKNFNYVHKQRTNLNKVSRFSHSKKALLALTIIIVLMTLMMTISFAAGGIQK
jgi:hypothetical protein